MSRLFIFCALFLNLVDIKAQPYRPMPFDSMTTWLVNFHIQDPGFDCYCDSYYIYQNWGEITLDTLDYEYILMDGLPLCECGGGDVLYDAYVRQDSIERRVYIMDETDWTEKILYDFSLEVGDTVVSFLTGSGCDYPIIDVVDSVLINGLYHRRLHIQNESCMYDETYFIEGIGSTSGLLQEISQSNDANHTLICVSHNGQAIYPDAGSWCPYLLDVDNLSKSQKVHVYPNPISQEQLLHIEVENKIYKIELYSVLQNKIDLLLVDGENQIVLDLNGIPKGIYFVVITTDEERRVQKLIVQ